STASEGSASVVVELLTSADTTKAFQDVKNEVDGITSFPEDAERPIVSLVESRRRVITLVLYGDQDPRKLRQLAERVRDDLVQRPGVTLVELGLSPPLEISVEVPQATLREYNLTLPQIASIIRQTALELPGGELKTSHGRILLRTQERRDYASEFRDIPLTTSPSGVVLRLGDIAQIEEKFQEVDQEAWFGGKPATTIQAFRVGDETPQSVAQAVQDYIDEIAPELPDDVKLSIWEDSSKLYKDRMALLMKNAVMGLTLVLLLLGVFLEPRLAFWVTLGIPVSVLGCFLFMPFTGASINMISLFAFIITLGIIVDDAVVVGENIYEKRERGMSPLRAAVMGVHEIIMPVTFAVLTNIVAFFPLFFVPGISGKFFRQIPSVVVAVFFVLLIESLFVLPSHLSHATKQTRFWRTLNWPRVHCDAFLKRFISEWYAPFVERAIRHRYVTMAIACAVLIASFGLVAGGHLRFTFMPKIDSDLVTAQATLPFGVPIEEARVVQSRLHEAAVKTIEESGGERIVKGIYSQIGKNLTAGHSPGPRVAGAGGSHLVGTQVSLVSSDLREISGTEFARRWRKNVGKVVGLETLSFRSDTGAREGSPIELHLSHRSRSITEQAASELAEALTQYAGVSDVDDGVAGGKRQFSLKLTPYARTLGITVQDLARQVRGAFYGAEALRQQRGRNEVKVLVKLPEEERSTLSTLDHLTIRTPQGGEVPFFMAASIEEGKSYTSISRRDGQRVVTVTADVDDQVSNANQIIEKVLEVDFPLLQRKYPGLTYRFGGEKEAQKESVSTLKIGFVISMLIIFAMLAIPFKSYIQPLIVMLSIPFGFIGAIGGHYLLGYGLSIISMFGIIALAGVVVNDSLVLVVTANRLREEGKTPHEAISQAGTRRFRPILLTSLTTFFGLAPMIFESSMQARFLIPMAISLGFGILFSTVIILAIVPSVYLIVEDVKEWLDSRFAHES
ncbi:MAG: efflux RND transporter permease subunit, partial [Bdellovibrionales bacterium]|nr:efflux RND transporter permease subunit [Bdellovibrionales bacterium]